MAQALWQVEDVIREIADYSDTHLAVPLLGCQADMLQCDSSDFDPRCPGLCTDLSITADVASRLHHTRHAACGTDGGDCMGFAVGTWWWLQRGIGLRRAVLTGRMWS